MTIRVEQHPSIPLAVVRRRALRAELGRVVPEACGFVWNALRSQGITGGGRHVAVYLDQVIHVEVGVELDRPYSGDARLAASSTPAGRVAAMTHRGAYTNLGGTHDAIREWCRRESQVPAGPCWEVYGHWEDDWIEHPERIRTEVCHLLGSAR